MAPPNNPTKTDRPLIAAADTPLIVDTARDAKNDPRGDNRPGVLPDLPLEKGIDPVTNRRVEELDPETGTVKASNELSGAPLNPPIQPSAPGGDKPRGAMIEMIALRDYWPRSRPDDHPADQDYRVKAGDTFKVPRSEADDLMEAGTAKRADPRA